MDLLGRQDLDGDLGEGLLVDGEEDLAHAPFAQRAEDPVSAQEEAPGGAREELAGLIGREQSLLDQEPGQPERGVGRGFGVDLARACASSAAGTRPDVATCVHEVVEVEHFQVTLRVQWHGEAGRPTAPSTRIRGRDTSRTSGLEPTCRRIRGRRSGAIRPAGTGRAAATTWMIRQVTLSLESFSRAMSLSMTAAC